MRLRSTRPADAARPSGAPRVPGATDEARRRPSAGPVARWWASRAGRRFRRIWGPSLLGLAIGMWMASSQDVRVAVGGGLAHLRATALAQPEFRIRLLEVTGARRTAVGDVIDALALTDATRSSLAFDAEAARRDVESLGWVARARVTLKPPQTLEVEIHERRPAALWREAAGLRLIDAGGAVIERDAERAQWPHLPLLLGSGANLVAVEGLSIERSARAAGLPVVGLVRVGGRRWDLELIDGPRVLLPEVGVRTAIDTVARWSRERALLGRDAEAVDLRLPHSPTVRLRERLGDAGGPGGVDDAAPTEERAAPAQPEDA